MMHQRRGRVFQVIAQYAALLRLSLRVSVERAFRAKAREVLGGGMDKQIFRANSGLRSYDMIDISAPVNIGSIYPNFNGFGALRQPPQNKPIEFKGVSPDDHIVFIHLAAPRQLDAGIASKVRPITPRVGDAAIVPFGADSLWSHEYGDADVFHMHLSPERLANMLGDDETCGRPVELVPQVLVRDEMISRLGQHCLSELQNPGLASRAFVESLALALGVHLLRRHSTAGRKATASDYVIAPYRLRRAREFIEAHLSDDIGLGDIAAAAGLSPFHFARAFKKATGRSPYRYLIERRIAYARMLLMTTDLPLSEIALASGFSSQQQFTSMFGKIVGTTPARFRRDYRV